MLTTILILLILSFLAICFTIYISGNIGNRILDENEIYTFRYKAYALATSIDIQTTTKITVEGSGGSHTIKLEGAILNVEGYTPPDPTDNTNTTEDDEEPLPWWYYFFDYLKNPFSTIPRGLLTVTLIVIFIALVYTFNNLIGLRSVLKK